MTTFLLIRHASYDGVGRVLGGRGAGLHLNAQGREEAKRLTTLAPEAIYSSPLERAQETALPLARHRGLPVLPCAALNEIDFGAWTGCSFAELDPQPEWQHWNAARGEARAKGGESMVEVQQRITGELEVLARRHEGQTVALFSHGDVIKAALLHALGLPLGAIFRLEVSPASVSALAFRDGAPQLTLLNGRCPLA